ncbi:pimeloyl-ACP methyl esterase BioG family protein [Tropicibacter sp. Alg240-R139]|uniref:pimeloyl-ACP methyl esterase BioG family protein n=1 Tax=Tropicibacter sp. Alg240-R139 TaxID=2305991 RepID=UPI0013DFD938|nr:pimeloyl-ACP methyl esterase BioG family protein [Tropicibacter sp. Alg240-R139]
MKTNWLQQSNTADEVIVIFGGWALGAAPFDHLHGPQDVLFVQDYRDFMTALPDLSSYARATLVAYSFGVASYAHWQATHPDPFDRKVAINGTCTPVNRVTGIPPVALSKTIETLSPQAYQLFLARCYGVKQESAEIDVDARKAELIAIGERGDASVVAFDQIWISSADKIMPAANQLRGWQGQENRVTQIDAPHVPFACWSNWQEVIGP